MRLGSHHDRPPRREPTLPDRGRAPFSARASLALLSRAYRHRRSGFGLFAGAAILAHLMAVAAIVLLPRAIGLLHRGPPPPEGQATIELVMQDTPTVGGSKAASPARPHTPADTARTQTPAPRAPLASRNAQDELSASSATAEAPAARQAAQPAQPAKASNAAPEINLDPSGEPGYGLVSGDNVVPASPDSANLNAPPVYPVAAAERGEQGSVYLVATIAPDGHPTQVVVAASSGYSQLDDEAVRTVSRWHFRPAIRDGQPIQSFFNERIEFDLRERP